MNTSGLRTIAIITFLAGLLSCQKKDTVVPNAADVQVNVTSPVQDAVYKNGDTIKINADISYTGQLHGYIVQITEKDGNVLFETEGHTHGDKLTIDEQWINTIADNADLVLTLTTIIDHDEKLKKVNVGFRSQP